MKSVFAATGMIVIVGVAMLSYMQVTGGKPNGPFIQETTEIVMGEKNND